MSLISLNTNSKRFNSNKIYSVLNFPRFPARTIIMWYGPPEDLPQGWQICDGSSYNGYTTPDLRSRFVISAGEGAGLTERKLGSIGGEENHTLTVSEIPVHNHAITDPGHNHAITDPSHNHAITDPGHNHTYYNNSNDAQPAVSLTTMTVANYNEVAQTTLTSTTGISVNNNTTGISVNNNTTGISVNNNGGGSSHNNMPPFYALYYIMKCFDG